MNDGTDAPERPAVFRLMYRSRDRIDPERRRVEHGELFTAARCVACGRIEGLTDLLVDGIPRQEVADRV